MLTRDIYCIVISEDRGLVSVLSVFHKPTNLFILEQVSQMEILDD
jgi:hypothetical protein